MADQANQMKNWFFKKKVLITGATSGIGRALALWYLNNGAQVILVGRDLQELTQIGQSYPAQALVAKCDLTVDIQVFHLKQAVEKFTAGRLDVLINCAGNIFAGDIESTFPQDYDYLMDINLRSPFIMTQFFQEELAKSSGVIINVSCDKGSRPEAGQLGYCMAKAGLEMLTKSTALELAAMGIRVNAVAPCFVQTSNESNLYRYSGLTENEIDSLKKRAANNIPLVRKFDGCPTTADERVVRDQEVAKAVIYLTSEMAQKITGHVMHVDGGKTLTSKGQQDWYGSTQMNRKFEQDSLAYYSRLFASEPREQPMPRDEMDKQEWVNRRGASSVWTGTSEDLHIKVTADYSNQLVDREEQENFVQMNKDPIPATRK